MSVELGAEYRRKSMPLAHLSIEVGHLYFEDYGAGADGLRRHFAEVAPWLEAARTIYAGALAGRAPRISTCFLIDDYFSPSRSPAEVIPDLLRAASRAGVGIDYLVREAGCAEADGVLLARLVEERIVADPPPETTGTRPPVTEVGWLCNGTRSPSAQTGPAMDDLVAWAPPAENAAARHSVFVDVEIWDERHGQRVWSCAFLAAVWQLLRLGLLRYRGAPVAQPQLWETDLPDEWERLPAVIQLNPGAQPFAAYRSLSILANRFFPTEHAVRTILSQVAVDSAIVDQVVERGRAEKRELPRETVDRVDYVFLTRAPGPTPTDP